MQVVGADVAPAVMLVQERGREFQNVDVFAVEDIFKDRPAFDYCRRQRLMGLHPVAVGAHDVERVRRHREAEDDRETLRGVGRA
jgi:hypothetical protein